MIKQQFIELVKSEIRPGRKLSVVRLMNIVKKPISACNVGEFRGLRELKLFMDKNYDVNKAHRLWNYAKGNKQLDRKG